MLKPTVVLVVVTVLVGPVPAEEAETETTIELPTVLPTNLSTDDTRVIRTKDGAEMVYVPAGRFRMGHTEAEYEAAVKDAKAQGVPGKPGYDGREVVSVFIPMYYEKRVNETAKELFWSAMSAIELTLPAYLIDKYEVSNAQYMGFIEGTGHRRPKDSFANETQWTKDGYPQGLDNHPVTNVSARDARKYCEWVGSRLPTEAEWEKAARGSEGLVYPWGNDWVAGRANHGRIGEVTEMRENKFERKLEEVSAGKQWSEDPSDGCELTCSSGEFAIDEGGSPYGAQDMAGNVWEWVDAIRVPTTVARTPDTEQYESPMAVRGGCYQSPPVYLRTTTRVFLDGEYRYSTVGFRCAQELREPD